MILSNKQNAPFYLLVLSNFIASFGGGTILGKGIHIIDLPLLQGGSILAFFIGSTLGIVFKPFITNLKSKAILRWFSIFCAITSLALLIVFNEFSAHGKFLDLYPTLTFFGLLSLRFSFWYYSRTTRVAEAILQQQNMALIDFGYYSGIIVGTLVWVLPGIDIGMSIVLMIDIAFQFMAGVCDLLAYRMAKNTKKQPCNVEATTEEQEKSNQGSVDVDKSWIWRLTLSTLLFTISVQGVIFDLTHHLSEKFSPYILSFFYLGAAVSSVFCNRHNIALDWPIGQKNDCYAKITLDLQGKKRSIHFWVICMFLSLSVISAVLMTEYGVLNNITFKIGGILSSMLLVFDFLSAFLIEVILIGIINRIGFEERNAKQKNMIMLTYGLMAMSLAIGFWTMGFFENIILDFTGVVVASFFIIMLLVNKRKNTNQQRVESR